MNKKFSTLMLGMLLTSAFASADQIAFDKLEQATFDEKGIVSGTYFLVQDCDGQEGLTAKDLILLVKKAADGSLAYQAIYYDYALQNASNYDQSEFEWALEVKQDVNSHYYYAFKNEALGTYLTFPKEPNATPVTAIDKSQKAEVGTENTSYFTSASSSGEDAWVPGGSLYAYVTTSNALTFKKGNAGTVGLGGDDATNKFYLYKYAAQTYDDYAAAAKALNDAKGGAGFNLKFSADNTYKWANDILTDANLKAFYVSTAIKVNEANNYSIPAGVYFATEYPASLAATAEIKTQEEFEACTFIAVDPQKNYNINKAADKGVGFEFKTVKGSELNKYQGDVEANVSTGSEVYVGNACITVVEPDPLSAAGEYNFMFEKVRHLKDLTKTEQTATEDLYVGYVADQNLNYLITVNPDAGVSGTILPFTTTNSTLYDVTKLLKSEDAPSIYTMQFVSEVYYWCDKNHTTVVKRLIFSQI